MKNKNNKIIRFKDMILQVGEIKLHDLVHGCLVIGFSDDGKEVYTAPGEDNPNFLVRDGWVFEEAQSYHQPRCVK